MKLSDASESQRMQCESRIFHNIALLVEYDGTLFCGWQSQRNGNAIQDILQGVILKLTGETVKINGCSRTDAGVHASGHVSNFKSTTKIPMDKLPLAMNSLLPMQIAVKKAVYVEDDFHSRFNAVGKRYRYTVWNEPTRSALHSGQSHHIPYPLQVDLMRKAASMMLGTKDFAAFMASGSAVKSTIRTIHDIQILEELPQIHMVFHGNGFLYNMVRILAGTLCYVGAGKIPPDAINGIIDSRDRTKAGKTLPACGLTLENVYYEQDIFL